VRRSFVALLTLALASPAYAHSTFGQIGGFWSGAAHVALSPIAMAILLAVACRSATQTAGAAYLGIAIAAVSSAVAAATTTSDLLGPAAAALIGCLVTWSPTHWRYESALIGLLAGVATGASVALDEPGWLGSLGVAVASGIIAMFAFEGLAWLERISPIPRRVVGSWVAALGLLLTALALRGFTD
jgi:hydrogenase/urease accessory protein HupE